VAGYEEEKAAFVARVTESRVKLARVKQLLYMCQSCVAVDIRMREAENQHQKIISEVSKGCDQLLHSIGTSCEKLKSTNSKCALDLSRRRLCCSCEGCTCQQGPQG
jgi:phenylpyruvate tautomerase PptA (4-oxalocrotonate tautomerase family)